MMPERLEPDLHSEMPYRANGAGRRFVVRLSVVVPCFNEQEVLAVLHTRVAAACEAVAPASYEIVLVNDGSTDRTWVSMLELAASDPHVVLVNLSRNHGHQLALTAGLSLCRGERVLIIDADLQDPPELLPEMMRLMDGGADVVYGKRKRRAGETGVKRLTAWLFYRLFECLSDGSMPHDTGDFRLVSRRALDVLLTLPERHRYLRGMVSWIGFRQEPILYDRHARAAGTSKYSLWKMLRFATDAVTAFSVKPLCMGVWLGPLILLGALGLAVFALARWLGGDEASWAFVGAIAATVGGLQMMVLGVMGVYLGRLVEQGRGRPLFIIDQVVRNEEHAGAGGDVHSGRPTTPPTRADEQRVSGPARQRGRPARTEPR